jgi:hypothetical protein
MTKVVDTPQHRVLVPMPTITAPLIDADLWSNGLDEKVSPVTRLALHEATRQDLAGLGKTRAGIGGARTFSAPCP